MLSYKIKSINVSTATQDMGGAVSVQVNSTISDKVSEIARKKYIVPDVPDEKGSTDKNPSVVEFLHIASTGRIDMAGSPMSPLKRPLPSLLNVNNSFAASSNKMKSTLSLRAMALRQHSRQDNAYIPQELVHAASFMLKKTSSKSMSSSKGSNVSPPGSTNSLAVISEGMNTDAEVVRYFIINLKCLPKLNLSAAIRHLLKKALALCPSPLHL